MTTKDHIMAIIAAATEDKDAVTFPYGSDSKLSSGLCTQVTLPGAASAPMSLSQVLPRHTVSISLDI